MPVSRRVRAGLIMALGVAVFALAKLLAPERDAHELALLAAAITFGELLVLRLEDRSCVPLSYAFLVVMASAFPAPDYLVSAVAAELVAMFLVRTRENENLGRLSVLGIRIAVIVATILAYRVVFDLFPKNGLPRTLIALAAAVLAQFVVDSGARWVLRHGRGLTHRARLAWLVVASSGMLMAVGYQGVNGDGDFRLWGVVLFSTPLLAAWYAFERLDSATLAYRQTIEALAMAPELGGLVPAGHAERVASLAVGMGHRLGLHADDLEDLEMAALLHHVGQVTLEDPAVAGRPEAFQVAAVSGSMLREIKPLARAGDIVLGESDDQRRKMAAQVLRLASEFDDLTTIDGTPTAVALETLRSAPRYIYDERVLSALERAVTEPAPTAATG